MTSVSTNLPLPVELRSATQPLAMLRNHTIGAVELLNLFLARVERLNPGLNLVIALDVEGALRPILSRVAIAPYPQQPVGREIVGVSTTRESMCQKARS